MSRRNFILTVIILFIVVLILLGFMYFNRGEPTDPNDPNGGGNFFSSWNPFSPKPTPEGDTPIPTPDYENLPPEELAEMKLKKISTMPIAGFGIFLKERLKEVLVQEEEVDGEEIAPLSQLILPETEFVTAVRYVEKENGIIYQTFADKIKESRFSSTVIPRIYEAFFGSRSEIVVMRYLQTDDETIETFVGTLPKEFVDVEPRDDNEIKGTFLPENTTEVAISADGNKIFYLFNSGLGTIGTTLEFLNNRKTQVFDSAFTEWLPWWPNNNMITLNTKPSATVPGYLYKLDLNNKNNTQILGDIAGLTTLMSPSGKTVLYAGGDLLLSLYNVDSREVIPLALRTLPEKCVWTPDEVYIYCAVPKNTSLGFYPDIWYQGGVSFDDQLWRINVSDLSTLLILNPTSEVNGEEIDMTRLSLDENRNYLFFMNKKDSFLWEFDLR